jgi:hypothetical protein
MNADNATTAALVLAMKRIPAFERQTGRFLVFGEDGQAIENGRLLSAEEVLERFNR